MGALVLTSLCALSFGFVRCTGFCCSCFSRLPESDFPASGIPSVWWRCFGSHLPFLALARAVSRYQRASPSWLHFFLSGCYVLSVPCSVVLLLSSTFHQQASNSWNVALFAPDVVSTHFETTVAPAANNPDTVMVFPFQPGYKKQTHQQRTPSKKGCKHAQRHPHGSKRYKHGLPRLWGSRICNMPVPEECPWSLKVWGL